MTFQTLRLLLLFANSVLLFANCVREINFSSDGADLDILVVDGRFTNLDEPQLLRLTRPGNYGKQRFLPVRGAIITLSDDLGNQWKYDEVTHPDTAHYYFLNQVKGSPGRSYTLEILLADGTRYSTLPQQMPDIVPLDTFSVGGKTEQIVRANGLLTEEKYAILDIQTTVPDSNKNKYLRWDAHSVHLFSEIEKIYNPFAPPQKQCFFTVFFNGQNITIADLGRLQSGSVLRREIAKKKIDQTFEWRIFFNVYQYNMTTEGFHYWRKIQSLISQNGTILDTPPAPVPGNVYLNGDPQQPTQGFFEVCAADVKRISIVNGELGPEYSYYPAYCAYDWISGKWPPVNHLECDDCLLLTGASLSKPWYW